MKFKGLILAAGRGSRLGKLTKNFPKPLVSVAGKRLIDWQMESLKTVGISDISIVTGYQADAFSDIDAKKINNPYWESSNMVRSLLCADELLSSAVTIISYGDILYHPDIVNSLIKYENDLCISYDTKWYELWSERFENILDDAESFTHKNGYLLSIGKKVVKTKLIQGQYMGLLVIDPDSWASVKEYLNTIGDIKINALDMTALLSQLLSKGMPIKVESVNGCWVEVDNQDDILLYEEKIKNKWSHDWRW